MRGLRSRGMGLVMVMLLVAAVAAAATGVAGRWAEQLHREKEDELLRVGNLYARAISSYRQGVQGQQGRHPVRLEDLLEDTRVGQVRRHLRALYPDPVDPQAPWGLVRAPDGGIMGVHSTSERSTWRRVAIALPSTDLAPASRYADWKFVPR